MSHGEFELINLLREESGRGRRLAGSGLVRGIGDDAAVVAQRAGFETVVTADLLVEEIDFKLNHGGDAPLSREAAILGRRAVAVSLSDVAAMGARPRWLLLSVGVPLKLWGRNFAPDFINSAREFAEGFGVALVGGDISRTPERVVVDSLVLGEVRRGRAVLRSGARPGDQLFVTGSLGGAAFTLRDTRRQTWPQPVSTSRNQAAAGRAKHSTVRAAWPQPRVEWGRFLGERRLAAAMIDLSDGLSSDLAHLCRESGVGALVEADRLPLDPLLKRRRLKRGDALSLALDGGEDFELLFAVRPRNVAKLPEEIGGVPVTRVGEITKDAGTIELLDGKTRRALLPGGFQHFKRA